MRKRVIRPNTGSRSRRSRASPARAIGSAPKIKNVRSALIFLQRTVRAVRIAATDRRIPKPLRWLVALALAPIPGPFDEALLLIAAIPLALFYREPVAEA